MTQPQLKGCREHAQAERVIEEERQAKEAQTSRTPTFITPTPAISPSFELEEPEDIPASPQRIPQITQDDADDYKDSPAANTRQQRETR